MDIFFSEIDGLPVETSPPLIFQVVGQHTSPGCDCQGGARFEFDLGLEEWVIYDYLVPRCWGYAGYPHERGHIPLNLAVDLFEQDIGIKLLYAGSIRDNQISGPCVVDFSEVRCCIRRGQSAYIVEAWYDDWLAKTQCKYCKRRMSRSNVGLAKGKILSWTRSRGNWFCSENCIVKEKERWLRETMQAINHKQEQKGF